MATGGSTTHTAITDMDDILTMRTTVKLIFRLFPLLILTACVSMPDGPSIMALPGKGKNFDQFRNDDHACRHYARELIGGITANDAAISSGLNSAVIASALGAIAGVALGGGHGAAIGAGTGLLVGGLTGSDNAHASGFTHQQRYDQGYIQCMYAKEHHVPVTGTFRNDPYPYTSGGNISNLPPPPPPGYPRASFY